MYILIKEQLPERVAENWKSQFYDFEREMWNDQYGTGQHLSDVYNQLVQLEIPTKEQIDEIIGNDTWTTLICSECFDEGLDYLIVLGELMIGDGYGFCPNCLNKANVLSVEYMFGEVQPSEPNESATPSILPLSLD